MAGNVGLSDLFSRTKSFTIPAQFLKIGATFGTDKHGFQTMHPIDFGDPLIFLLVPP